MLREPGRQSFGIFHFARSPQVSQGPALAGSSSPSLGPSGMLGLFSSFCFSWGGVSLVKAQSLL